MNFDYYIFIDYSENFVGYTIIEKEKVAKLLPLLSRFRHYKGAKNRKLYLKNVSKTIKRENVKSYLYKVKILRARNNVGLYLDILEFLREHSNCAVFISVDNNEYDGFKRFVKVIDCGKAKIAKESELKKGSTEYKLSLIIDNLLNIRRIKE